MTQDQVIEVLRRAWDALDIFKQTYPENWADCDEQLLNDLMRTDMKLSGVKLKWVGLTDDEQSFIYDQVKQIVDSKPFWVRFADAIEAKLKEKNT